MAKARGLEVKALCWPFAENDRAQAERETPSWRSSPVLYRKLKARPA